MKGDLERTIRKVIARNSSMNLKKREILTEDLLEEISKLLAENCPGCYARI